jgi:hypothetical protein
MFLVWSYFFQKDLISASGQGFDGSLDHLVNGGRDANGKHATSRHSGEYHNNVTSEEDTGCQAGRSRGTARLARVHFSTSGRLSVSQHIRGGTLSLFESRPGRFPCTASGSGRVH